MSAGKDINVRSNDTIYRQAAIDAICKCTDIFVTNLPVMVDKADAYKALAELPSAQTERKAGKWIAHPGGKFVGFPYQHYECDQCRDFEPEARNYCPNCGASMAEFMNPPEGGEHE